MRSSKTCCERKETHAKKAVVRSRNVEKTPANGTWKRRTCLGTAPLLYLAGKTPPSATGYLIQQDVSQAVFETGSVSSVAVLIETTNGKDAEIDGVGSGIVWDREGHIVTNYHVVEKVVQDTAGNHKVKVSLPGTSASQVQDQIEAYVVGTRKNLDVAVLKVDLEPSQLNAVRIGTARDLKVGQWAFAIGNPYGLSNTLTCGVISGLNRTFPSPTGMEITGAIQTDAAISRGNSGGALLNSSGTLIGMNTATYTRKDTGRSSGVNFAVPVDAISEAVTAIVAN